MAEITPLRITKFKWGIVRCIKPNLMLFILHVQYYLRKPTYKRILRVRIKWFNESEEPLAEYELKQTAKIPRTGTPLRVGWHKLYFNPEFTYEKKEVPKYAILTAEVETQHEILTAEFYAQPSRIYTLWINTKFKVKIIVRKVGGLAQKLKAIARWRAKHG